MSPPLVPQLNQEIHFVLCRFGNAQAYVETDPSQADRAQIVRNFIAGEYDQPIAVLCCNLTDGWARDVSISIAREIKETDAALTIGTREFVDKLLAKSASREN